MKDKFDKRAEREYYKEPLGQLIVTDSKSIEAMLKLCTNDDNWASLLNGKKVLELGAGGCSFIRTFLKKASPDIYIASDIFADRLLTAKRLGNYHRTEYIGADVLSLPIRDCSMDLCMAFGMLHHIPNLEEALIEIIRVLKVGGYFIFKDPWAGNPVVWLKYKFGHASENEFPLSAKKTRHYLAKHGLRLLYFNHFWIRYPSLPSGPWSTNIGGLATKD